MTDAPPILLSDVGSLTGPGFDEPTTRTFVFGATDTRPSFIAAYTKVGNEAKLTHTAIISEYIRARQPRRDAAIVKLASGEEWSFRLVGCACGNPVKRVSWTQALQDLEGAYP